MANDNTIVGMGHSGPKKDVNQRRAALGAALAAQPYKRVAPLAIHMTSSAYRAVQKHPWSGQPLGHSLPPCTQTSQGRGTRLRFEMCFGPFKSSRTPSDAGDGHTCRHGIHGGGAVLPLGRHPADTWTQQPSRIGKTSSKTNHTANVIQPWMTGGSCYVSLSSDRHRSVPGKIGGPGTAGNRLRRPTVRTSLSCGHRASRGGRTKRRRGAWSRACTRPEAQITGGRCMQSSVWRSARIS
mmetsp:Transcript_136791/g.381314  ORF Transcript_136791/g.381314 Transcript_136791/m.381314 type:complete len:239 (+) Transcript_136791:81-797(+)